MLCYGIKIQLKCSIGFVQQMWAGYGFEFIAQNNLC